MENYITRITHIIGKNMNKHKMIKEIFVNEVIDGPTQVQVSYHETIPLSEDEYI